MTCFIWVFNYSQTAFSFRCPDGTISFVKMIKHFYTKQSFKKTYRIFWAILGAFVPLLILTVCNVRLIMEVSRSKARNATDQAKYATSRITIILITVIVLHVVLVCPSIILSFLLEIFVSHKNLQQYYHYLIAIILANVMQAVNFAVNFILYCIISKTFRDNLKGRCGTLARIASTPRTTPRTSSGELNHRYQLVEINSKSTTLSKPPSNNKLYQCVS